MGKLQQIQADIGEVLVRHEVSMGLMGVVFIDEGGNLVAEGFTLVRKVPKDHEENLLRDNAAKKVTLLITDLLNNTYPEIKGG